VFVPPKVVTPVPPLLTAIVVALQVPVVIVPTETRDDKVVTALLTRVPEVGSVTFVNPEVVKVREFAPEIIRLEPSARFKVADVAGAVIKTLLTDVAVTAPIVVIFVVPVHVERAVFSTLFKDNKDFTVDAERTSTSPVNDVFLPKIEAVAICASIPRVTLFAPMVVVIAVVPEPEISPDNVIV
jgi:hypothetical protein